MKLTKIICWATAAAMLSIGLCSCQEEQDVTESDLFSPRMISGYPKVDGNNIMYVWYEITGAQSYSIELSYSEAFDQIIRSEEHITEPLYEASNLYYDTDVYARVKAHSAAAGHDSKWHVELIRTDVRDVAPILHEVDPADISETSVRVTWDVTAENPANLLTVKELISDTYDPAVDPEPQNLRIELSDGQFAAGEYLIEGLKGTTTYELCLHNTLVENVNDQPYNKVIVKTSGAPEGSIAVRAGDDLSALLQANESNPDIPDGQVYSLAPGTSFNVTGYPFSKGFILEAQPGEMPTVVIDKAFTPTGNTGMVQIIGVNLVGQESFFTGRSYEFEGLVIKDCLVSGFPKYFLYMTVDAGSSTILKRFEVDNTIFNGMTTNGKHLLSMDSSYDASVNLARIDEIYFTNSTIMNSPKLGGIVFVTDNACNYTYHIELDHVTVFESCTSKNRFIHINGATTSDSRVKIHNFLLSNEKTWSDNSGTLGMVYQTCLTKSKPTDFANNYRTKGLDEVSRSGGTANTTMLDLTQAELFTDPDNGDLTIKATDSDIYTKQVGDPRWIK